MESMHAVLLPLRVAVLVLIPALSVCGALWAGSSRAAVQLRWRLARRISAAALLGALLVCLALCARGPAVWLGPELLPLGPLGSVHLSLRSDAPSSALLLLGTFLGWTIVRYSQSYLAAERGERRYLRGLFATLGAVTPLRLSVFIDAPRFAIELVMARNSHVRELVQHEWLHLFQIDPLQGQIVRYRGGTWTPEASRLGAGWTAAPAAG